MPYIDIEDENVWVLDRLLRSMDMVTAVSRCRRRCPMCFGGR